MAQNIQLLSNVKIITSGNKPTTANLLPGQAAFGKITEDGKYHLYGNTGEGGGAGKVVDIVLDTFNSAYDIPTLEQVLTSGKTTTLDITFNSDNGHVTIVGHDGITVSDGTRVLSMKAGEGFKDGGFAVLSGNPNNTVNAAEQGTMRTALDVFSKSEVQALVANVYKYKGTKTSFEALVGDDAYTPVVGDVWNIETAGGADKSGKAIKAGDNVAFVGPNKATDWDVLAGVVDLSGYYTKTEVDGIKSNLEGKISAAQTKAEQGVTDAAAAKQAADAAQGTADAAQEAANGANTAAGNAQTTANEAKQAAADAQADVDEIAKDYVKNSEFDAKAKGVVNTVLGEHNYAEDANYVHTDNNYTDADKGKVDKLVFTGDGTKVLADDGTMKALDFAVVEI